MSQHMSEDFLAQFKAKIVFKAPDPLRDPQQLASSLWEFRTGVHTIRTSDPFLVAAFETGVLDGLVVEVDSYQGNLSDKRTVTMHSTQDQSKYDLVLFIDRGEIEVFEEVNFDLEAEEI